MARILIVDDDASLCEALAAVMASLGHAADQALSLHDGLAQVQAREYAAVILDVWLPDGNGLEHIAALRDSPGRPEVIILTGSGDPDGAELAIKSGAWDYITKPPTLNKIRLPVQRALAYRSRQERKVHRDLKRENIVGGSGAILACLDLAAQAAASDVAVLITGQTGTGKELFARVIHANSERSQGPFVVVDCAALPANLVESMLFGHEKGAFTNADRKHDGLIKQAHRGTLFLDEVGELPPPVQKAFLRVLQEHRCRPVGGNTEIVSDFRLVAATNRNLERMAADGRFREDLLFRLQSFNIHLPPLRERGGDVAELAEWWAGRLAERRRKSAKKLSPALLAALEDYAWPGNVRELLNAVENAIAAAGDEAVVEPGHLPVHLRAQMVRQGLVEPDAEVRGSELPVLDPGTFPPLKDYRARALASLERGYLEKLLSLADGDIRRACALSGLSRARLYALLKERGLGR